MITVNVKGQTLKIVRTIDGGGSGKLIVTVEGGQEIVYRPPAADVIRKALALAEKPAETPAETPALKPAEKPVEPPAKKSARRRFGSLRVQ